LSPKRIIRAGDLDESALAEPSDSLTMVNPARDNTCVPTAALMVRGLPEPALVEVAAIRVLTTAIARGDEAAFAELYDRYHARLFRLALVLGRGDELLAHDVVQSVMVTAARKLKPVETEAHLWNWLARVARQQVSKSRRRVRSESAVVIMPELPEFAPPPEPDSILNESLDLALASLEPEDRHVVELFYFETLTCKQISERLQTTPKAVSSRLERARLKLRMLVTRNLSNET
jgi:RNA polymerase sigma-70 factor (ECF subfamily)